MKHYNKYKIDYGVPPFKYSFYTSKDCVEFDTPNGTSDDDIIDVNIKVTSEICYSPNLNISLDIEDAKGCKNTITSALLNPCTTCNLPTINFNGGSYGTFKFSAKPNGGKSAYTYLWDYPKNIFKVVGNDTSQNLVLTTTFTVAQLPSYNYAYPISVTVTDANDCVRRNTYYYTFCRIQAKNVNKALQCFFCSYTSSGAIIDFKDYAIKCSDASIDWTTLTISLFDPSFSGFSYINHGDGTATVCVDLYTLSQSGWDPIINANLLALNWSVQDTKGLESNVADLNVGIKDCLIESARCIETQQVIVEPDTCSGTPTDIKIDLTTSVFSGKAIDWSTFEFIPSSNTNQTFVNSNDPTYMSFTFGKVKLNANHEVEISFSGVPPSNVNSETISWKVCDVDGCCSSNSIITILSECNLPPVIVDRTTCATCGSPLETPVLDSYYIDGSANLSTGSDIIIITPPANGTVDVGSINIGTIKKGIIYTPNTTFYGTNDIEYQIKDDNGKTSATGKLTVNVICPGQGGEQPVCPE